MRDVFGHMPDGRAVDAFELRNSRISVRILTLGAAVHSVDFDGMPMVLSGSSVAEYLGEKRYFGAVVGRVANRIARGQAIVGTQSIQLDVNEAHGNCLHGGSDGSGVQVWSVTAQSESSVTLGLTMPDGHMGFPAALDVEVRYQLRDTTLLLEISARAERDTLCSFAPHGYWNLGGRADIDSHHLEIRAEHYLPVDQNMIPTGRIAPVDGTDLDFRRARPISGTSLDHNFCIAEQRSELQPVASLFNPETGVQLDVASTEAGLQIYDGRHVNRAGLAIEPQVWPDAVNQTGFPSMTLSQGARYHTISTFRLSRA